MFKEFVVEENEVVLRSKDLVNSLIIVKSGELQIIMTFDRNEFVVCKLTSGAVLNARNILNQGERISCT